MRSSEQPQTGRIVPMCACVFAQGDGGEGGRANVGHGPRTPPSLSPFNLAGARREGGSEVVRSFSIQLVVEWVDDGAAARRMAPGEGKGKDGGRLNRRPVSLVVVLVQGNPYPVLHQTTASKPIYGGMCGPHHRWWQSRVFTSATSVTSVTVRDRA